MIVKSFQELIVWQRAHIFVMEIYRLTKNFPDSERYGLTSQLRRAAVSIPSNIAEGFTRNGDADRLRFYNIADGSLEESKYQLILAKDLGYIAHAEFESVFTLSEEVGRLLHGWVKSQ